MDKQLADIYYNPETGFSGFDQFYNKVKDSQYLKSDIWDWYKKQQVNQIYKQPQKKFNKIVSASNDIGTL